MIQSLFKSAALFALISVFQAKADYSEPACTGQQIDQSVRGTYAFDERDLVLGEDSVTSGDGTRFKSWTCVKNGVLIWVLQFQPDGHPDLEFESNAIAVSGDLLILLGEVVGDVVNPYDPGEEAPLSKEGVSWLMKSGSFEIVQKNK